MTTNNSVNLNHNGVSGSVSFVGDHNATLVTPILGTPASGVLTNCTGISMTADITGILLAANLLPFGTNNTKIIQFTRNVSLTSTQTVTGVGFTPSLVMFFTTINAVNTIATGFDNGSTFFQIHFAPTAATWANSSPSASIIAAVTDTAYTYANISSFNSDGFVLTWTKVGSPTGTATILALCFY